MSRIRYFCVGVTDSYDRKCKYGKVLMSDEPCKSCNRNERKDAYTRPSHWQPTRRQFSLRKRQTQAANTQRDEMAAKPTRSGADDKGGL